MMMFIPTFPGWPPFLGSTMLFGASFVNQKEGLALHDVRKAMLWPCRVPFASKTAGYRWRSRPAERKPGRSRLTGPCRKAQDAGFRGRPTDFANGIRTDTVGEVGSSRREGGEARGAGGGARDRPEPGGEALEIDRGRGRHVLQAGPGQPPVAAAAQPEGAHALRDRALDPGSPRVEPPALLRREPAPGGPERLVLRPRLQLQVAGAVLGARAKGPRRAGTAVGLAEHHRDVARAGVVDLRAPGRGQLPLRAADPLRLPVDLEQVDRVAALDLGLPGRVPARRTDQVDAVVLAAAHLASCTA